MNPVKPFIALGAGGTLATGAYLTSGYWMPSKEKEIKSILDALKGRKLISSTLSGDALVKQWEAEFESDRDSIRVLLGDNSLEKQQGGVNLSKWCSSKMFLDVDKNKEVFENVKKYCLIRSIADQLKRNKKTLLDVGKSDGWAETYGQRKKQNTSRTGVGLNGEWQSPPEQQQDLETIKTWCSSNGGEDFLASQKGDDSTYIKVLKWCTKDGASEN